MLESSHWLAPHVKSHHKITVAKKCKLMLVCMLIFQIALGTLTPVFADGETDSVRISYSPTGTATALPPDHGSSDDAREAMRKAMWDAEPSPSDGQVVGLSTTVEFPEGNPALKIPKGAEATLTVLAADAGDGKLIRAQDALARETVAANPIPANTKLYLVDTGDQKELKALGDEGHRILPGVKSAVINEPEVHGPFRTENERAASVIYNSKEYEAKKAELQAKEKKLLHKQGIVRACLLLLGSWGGSVVLSSIDTNQILDIFMTGGVLGFVSAILSSINPASALQMGASATAGAINTYQLQVVNEAFHGSLDNTDPVEALRVHFEQNYKKPSGGYPLLKRWLFYVWNGESIERNTLLNKYVSRPLRWVTSKLPKWAVYPFNWFRTEDRNTQIITFAAMASHALLVSLGLLEPHKPDWKTSYFGDAILRDAIFSYLIALVTIIPFTAACGSFFQGTWDQLNKIYNRDGVLDSINDEERQAIKEGRFTLEMAKANLEKRFGKLGSSTGFHIFTVLISVFTMVPSVLSQNGFSSALHFLESFGAVAAAWLATIHISEYLHKKRAMAAAPCEEALK